MPKRLVAVNDVTTLPLPSTTHTLWPASPLAEAMAKACVPPVKLCAMPVEPTMSTVPPLTVALPS